MLISVINLTAGHIKDDELQTVIRAINRQISEDFEPYWHFGANLRLEGHGGSTKTKQSFADLRGDAILYLLKEPNVDDALGYHEANNDGIPYGFVFTGLSEELGESWTATFSHEALELLADPLANLLVQGPHPTEKRQVFHWFEMCDAVQSETYEIDGVTVSNFVLPLYFTEGAEAGARNDFLNRTHKRKTLKSFNVNPGGYIGFFDPKTGKHENFSVEADEAAAKRKAIKGRLASGRGNQRKRSMKATRR
ncbi:MAG: hypothetical protein QM776_06995 [Rhodocyclaceae bacterium]